MREIKFRAWNNLKKEWLFDFRLTPFGEIMKVQPQRYKSGDKYEYSIITLIGEDFALSQYTGLKDKNGKEIYEGDIVNRNTGYPPRVVTWQPKGRYTGWFASKPDDGTPYNTIDHLPLDVDGKEVEVIGNIYDNPELVNINN